MAVAITATEQDVWPVRMLVSVTGLTLASTVTVYRVVAAARTALRGADGVTAGDTSLVVTDAELPFGTPVSYTVAVNGADVASTSAATHTLVGAKVAVTDAITDTAAEVVIVAWPARDRERDASVYTAGGRTIVVSGPMAGTRSQLQLLTTTDIGRTTLEALLSGATSGVVQVRQPGGYDGVDSYLAILTVHEERFSQDGTDPRRTWTIDVAEVEAWPASFAAAGYTLADVAAAYTGLTLAALAGDHATLLDVARYDWGL